MMPKHAIVCPNIFDKMFALRINTNYDVMQNLRRSWNFRKHNFTMHATHRIFWFFCIVIFTQYFLVPKISTTKPTYIYLISNIRILAYNSNFRLIKKATLLQIYFFSLYRFFFFSRLSIYFQPHNICKVCYCCTHKYNFSLIFYFVVIDSNLCI